MNNNKNFRELPKDTKFATYNLETREILLGEYLIATSIYNGASFNQLLKPANGIENKKEREETKAQIINIILDFINLNPIYAIILEQNNKIKMIT